MRDPSKGVRSDLIDDLADAKQDIRNALSKLVSVDSGMRVLYDQTPFKKLRGDLNQALREVEHMYDSERRNLKAQNLW